MAEPTVSYPASLDTITTLIPVRNNKGGTATKYTLAGSVSSAATSVCANATIDSSVCSTGYLVVDYEVMYFSSYSGSVFTIDTRGADNTTAATHSASALLSVHPPVAKDHNQVASAIMLLEAVMGTCPFSPCAFKTMRLENQSSVPAAPAACMTLLYAKTALSRSSSLVSSVWAQQSDGYNTQLLGLVGGNAAGEFVQRGTAAYGGYVGNAYSLAYYHAPAATSFPVAFSSAPKVFINNDGGYVAAAAAITTTQFNVQWWDNVSGSVSANVSWLAIGS